MGTERNLRPRRYAMTSSTRTSRRTQVAFVELEPGSNATAAELIAHCKALLASYEVPREVRFEPIPKTSTGKIQKFALRELAAAASPLKETPK